MAGYAISLFWVIFMMFGGVVAPHEPMNDFYRPWLFWVDPMRYYFGASISTSLHGIQAVCKESDLATFDSPPGQTCGEYVQSYSQSNPGYLQNPSANPSCKYCSYSTGDDYARTINFFYDDRWRDWAVFLGFCLSNILLGFLISWFTRVQIRRWRR